MSAFAVVAAQAVPLGGALPLYSGLSVCRVLTSTEMPGPMEEVM